MGFNEILVDILVILLKGEWNTEKIPKNYENTTGIS